MDGGLRIAIGIIIIVIGALIGLGGVTKSEVLPIRMFAARAEVCWGDNKYSALAGYGALMMVFGVLFAAGVLAS